VDLADLRALLHVVEYGSFQRAAQALRVSRGALRRQVERLENELDVELLSRGTKGIELTAAGREFADGATWLLRDASNLAERARGARADARGTLRFILPTGIPHGLRAKALMGLRARHPELGVEVTEVEDPLSALAEPFDLMLHFGHAPNREGWFSHVVMRAQARLRASPAYLEAHGEPRALDELDEHQLLLWSAPGLELGGLPLHGGGSVRPSPWLRTANISLLYELAVAGAGLVYAPVLTHVFEQGQSLVPVLDDVVGAEVSLRALTPRPSRADPKIRAMLDNIQRQLATLDDRK
jgi:DNA-binding transcriptional LysR family regulator